MLNNPVVKAIASIALGGVFATIDAAVQHPTGGTAAWIAAAPSHAIIWTFGALVFHNIASQQQYAQK